MSDATPEEIEARDVSLMLQELNDYVWAKDDNCLFCEAHPGEFHNAGCKLDDYVIKHRGNDASAFLAMLPKGPGFR